jgi:hypothetical protein
MSKRSITRELAYGGAAPAAALLFVLFTIRGQEPGAGKPKGKAKGPTDSLSDPPPQDPALDGAIDLHSHLDPDSFGPSYGQAARSDDPLDLYARAKRPFRKRHFRKKQGDNICEV